MFETSNNTGIDQGTAVGFAIAIGNRIRGQEIAHHNDLVLTEQAHEAELARYQAVIDQLSRRLLDTQIELASERCEIAGLRAFIREVKRQDPATPALSASGQTYKSGKAKSMAALVYEREYDRKADDLGLPDLKGGYAT
ncbi:hypothetical protein BHAOGJBA_6022 [Methylobacterium hispanicum]|uniref:Transposase n=1 Tax=Methylobacterium hispanicum TaxID=270350 RepID=A0AAV4ZW33_9HYPH|nr:hypothetical protein [Methylobacterium hispanicum]GJD92468.1 hypothetical protein BHAOGJBA_6022 [Methylobacterium hispanicum]